MVLACEQTRAPSGYFKKVGLMGKDERARAAAAAAAVEEGEDEEDEYEDDEE